MMFRNGVMSVSKVVLSNPFDSEAVSGVQLEGDGKCG